MNPASFVFSLPAWVLLVIIALISIYFVTYLLPRSKIDLKGKYVLITGCDRGFGRATAIWLDKMGARVLATCLTKDGEQSLISSTTDKLKTFQLDVTNSQQIQELKTFQLDISDCTDTARSRKRPLRVGWLYCQIWAFEHVKIMHHSIPAVPIPPPGQPRGIS